MFDSRKVKSVAPPLQRFFEVVLPSLRAFALEAGRLGSNLSRVKPKTLKLVSAVTLAKRSEIKCSAEDEMNRE